MNATQLTKEILKSGFKSLGGGIYVKRIDNVIVSKWHVYDKDCGYADRFERQNGEWVKVENIGLKN